MYNEKEVLCNCIATEEPHHTVFCTFMMAYRARKNDKYSLFMQIFSMMV